MQRMQRLIDSMIVSGMLYTPRIIEAFEAVDRRYFVPNTFFDHTYVDAPLSIGEGQTISQPSTVAFMLEKLAPEEGERVLDIGAGSGWTTALLCHIVGEKGSVQGVERITSLVAQGSENLLKFRFGSHCSIVHAGEALGLPGEKFDRILVSASADEVPEMLFEQLNIGGVMVIPVRDSIYRFTKHSEGEIEREEFYGFVFVPLIY